MRVTIAVVCEAANVSQEGNLNLLGVFNEIKAPRFPAAHPVMVLVVRIQGTRAERGERVTMKVRLMDEDSVLAELEGEFAMPDTPDTGAPSVNNIFRLVGVELPRAGAYSFHILLNGSEAAEVPITARAIAGPS